MPEPDIRSADPTIRSLSRGLSDAEDLKMVQAVALVDAMPQRGAADLLLAPLRPRLGRLRPSRPLNFIRLLFTPLDPLIVQAPRWRPTEPSIPRTALPCIAATVRASLGPDVKPIDELIKGCTTHDGQILGQAGALLWPRAARVLMSAPPPVDWPATGLNIVAYPALARRIGAMLDQSGPLDALIAEAAIGVVQPSVEALLCILGNVGARVPDALPMMVTLLLARLPQASDSLARAASTMGRHGEVTLRHAGDQASGVLLAQMEVPGGLEAFIAGNGVTEAGAAVRRITSLLRALDDDKSTAERRERLREIRTRVDATCRTFFTQCLAEEFIAPLTALGGAAEAKPTTQLEVAARGLRELESEARGLGSGKLYDRLLETAVAEIRKLPNGASVGPVRRSRLVEILAGTDAALDMLRDGTA